MILSRINGMSENGRFLINGKRPILIGVTGCGDVCAEDVSLLKAAATAAIERVCAIACGHPVAMLNSLAQGASELCAEAAFSLGVPVFAVLPCAPDRYVTHFDDGERDKFFSSLRACRNGAAGGFVAPDAEHNFDMSQMTLADYERREAGIYIAEQCDVLLSVYGGGMPEPHPYGCGTEDIIAYAIRSSAPPAILNILRVSEKTGRERRAELKFMTVSDGGAVYSDEPPESLILAVRAILCGAR